jgi:gas vesicle protein
MSERDTDFGAYLAGFLIGGLVGAATALLLAPQSGEETRTMIRDKSIELKDKAAESAEDALNRATKALEDTRTRLGTVVDDLRVRVEELAETVRQQSSEVQVEGAPPPVPSEKEVKAQ